MPNSIKGEAPLVLSDGREFTLVADHAALISERLDRLVEIAGPRAIGSQVPTGADAADSPEPPQGQSPAMPVEMRAVEDKLRALAERLERKGEPESGD